MTKPIFQILDSIKTTAIRFFDKEIYIDFRGALGATNLVKHALKSQIAVTMRVKKLNGNQTGVITFFVPVIFAHYLANQYYSEETPLNSPFSNVRQIPLYNFFRNIQTCMDEHYKNALLEDFLLFQSLSTMQLGLSGNNHNLYSLNHFDIKIGADHFHFYFAFDKDAAEMLDRFISDKKSVENINTSLIPIEKQLDNSFQKLLKVRISSNDATISLGDLFALKSGGDIGINLGDLKMIIDDEELPIKLSFNKDGSAIVKIK